MISRATNASELLQSADVQFFDAIFADIQMSQILFPRREMDQVINCLQ